MTYGFKVEIKDDKFFEGLLYYYEKNLIHDLGEDLYLSYDFSPRKTRKRNLLPARDGWGTSYQLNSESNQILHLELTGDENTEFQILTSLGEKFEKWKEDYELLISVEKDVTLRRDGVGTITLSFEIQNKKNLSVSDILKVLNLTPRTRFGNLREDEVEKTNFDDRYSEYFNEVKSRLCEKTKDNFCRKSLPFKLFVKSVLIDLRELLEDEKTCKNAMKGYRSKYGLDVDIQNDVVWKEISLKTENERYHPLYDALVSQIEPQIPYCFVWAEMPQKEYGKLFLETKTNIDKIRKNREKYTKEIAAVIGKWLNWKKIEHTSLDYWERVGMVRDGVFYSQYMNSMAFTTFSGLVTFSIYQQNNKTSEKNILNTKPLYIIRESILRCIEYSRMRWHQAISLNREVDLLTREITSSNRKKTFTELLEKLIKLEESQTLSLEDPNPAFWEASVGSSLAEFLHVKIIDQIEKELSNKITSVRHLLKNKIETVKTKEVIDVVLEKDKTHK